MILIRTLRHSTRSLLRHPLFFITATLLLTLGIGANTTIFAVIDSILIKPLPYHDPDRLIMVWESNPAQGEPAGSRVPAARSNFDSWRERNHSFDGMEAFELADYNLTGTGNPEHLVAARATPGFFQLLGVSSNQGRSFVTGDDSAAAGHVAIITHSFRAQHFANTDPVGRTLLLDGAPHVIIGVLPQTFHLPALYQGSFEYKPVIWLPLPGATSADPPATTKLRQLFVCARLKPKISLTAAAADMATLASQLAATDPVLNSGYGVNLVPLPVENTDPDLRHALTYLAAAAALVLLLTCLNLGLLMLVRSLAQQKTTAIRAALGASRSALFLTLMSEGFILSFLGAVLGFAAAYGGIHLIVVLQPGDIHSPERIAITLQDFFFNTLVSFIPGFLVGVLPSWLAVCNNFSSALTFQKDPNSSTRGRSSIRPILVSIQIAIALSLAISATLLIRSFQRLNDIHPGFLANSVVTAHVSLPRTRYNDSRSRAQFCQRLLSTLGTLPEIEQAALIDNMPLYAIRYVAFEIEGHSVPQGSAAPTADYANVTPSFFDTMHIALRRGRLFTNQDTENTAERVVIINEALARHFWPNRDPIGSHIRSISPHTTPGPWWTVVGVVGDFLQYNIDTPARPELFWPANTFEQMTVVAKTRQNPRAFTATLQKTLSTIDPEQPISDLQTLQQMVNDSISQRRFNMTLLSTFAGLSILLALLGIYGLISYTISSTKRAIGIRFALGAQRKNVYRALISSTLPAIVLGLAFGLLLAYLSRKIIAALLFRISAFDLATNIVVTLAFLALLLATIAIPVWRAAQIDPIAVLRQE
jgi:putative ABC transport system permease protein